MQFVPSLDTAPSFHPLELLIYPAPIRKTESFLYEGRFFEKVHSAFQWSRRYSIVATHVGIIALNILFLVSKFDSRVPSEVGEMTLLLLSALGIGSFHYTLDLIYKSAQDFRFALDHAAKGVVLMSLLRIAMQTNNVLLTWLNFSAACLGASREEKQQINLYRKLVVWSETVLLLQVGMLFMDLLITRYTKKKLETGEALPRSFAPYIRLSMDKDTLWKMERSAQRSLHEGLEVVKQNLNTQIKVTYGSRLGLILLGYGLMALEKWKTPHSKTAAIVNLIASLLWGGVIFIEKYQEIWQRSKIR